jgi:hypothetical protein
VSKPYCETVNDPRLGTGGYPNQGPPSYHISNRQLRALAKQSIFPATGFEEDGLLRKGSQ